jgi:hypothetical protein
MVGSAHSLLFDVHFCPWGQSTSLWHWLRHCSSIPQTSGVVHWLV